MDGGLKGCLKTIQENIQIALAWLHRQGKEFVKVKTNDFFSQKIVLFLSKLKININTWIQILHSKCGINGGF